MQRHNRHPNGGVSDAIHAFRCCRCFSVVLIPELEFMVMAMTSKSLKENMFRPTPHLI